MCRHDWHYGTMTTRTIEVQLEIKNDLNSKNTHTNSFFFLMRTAIWQNEPYTRTTYYVPFESSASHVHVNKNESVVM